MTRGLDTLLTLEEAADELGGSIKVASLRAEARRGRLAIFKVGRRYYTTPKDLEEMKVKCRAEASAPVSTSIRNGAHGLSATESGTRALDALNQLAAKPKKH